MHSHFWSIGTTCRRCCFSLCLILLTGFAAAQDAGDTMLAEPTALSELAARSDATMTVIGHAAQVAGGDTLAEFAPVRVVTAEGEEHYGLRLLMTNGDSTDSLYLDRRQARELWKEISDAQPAYRDGAQCGARYRCIRGIARCRPSQSIAQSVCPSFYVTPDGRQGMTLATPRGSFELTYSEPVVVAETIVEALGSLGAVTRHD